MSILIHSDPHREWRPLLVTVAQNPPAAVVIQGNCDLVWPIHVDVAPVITAGVEVAHLYGNHEKDRLESRDNLVGDHFCGLLHGHRHQGYTRITTQGIQVIGLTKAELLVLGEWDLG